MITKQNKMAEKIILESDEIVSAKIGLDMDLFTLLEERRKEARDQQDILHKRIGSLREELQKGLGNSHKEIMSEIKELKQDQRDHASEMSDRVGKLEQWKWQAAGGFSLLAFLITIVLPYIKDHM